MASGQKNAASPRGSGVVRSRHVKRNCFVLGRPGSDLLSQVLRHSTIGAEEFNGRVRDGIGFRLLAKATRPAKDTQGSRMVCVVWACSGKLACVLQAKLAFASQACFCKPSEHGQ